MLGQTEQTEQTERQFKQLTREQIYETRSPPRSPPLSSLALDCVNASVTARANNILSNSLLLPNITTLDILCTQWLPKILHVASKVTKNVVFKMEFINAFNILVDDDSDRAKLKNDVIHYQEFFTIIGMSTIFLSNLIIFLNKEPKKISKLNATIVLNAYNIIVKDFEVITKQIIKLMKYEFVAHCISGVNEYCKTHSEINMLFAGTLDNDDDENNYFFKIKSSREYEAYNIINGGIDDTAPSVGTFQPSNKYKLSGGKETGMVHGIKRTMQRLGLFPDIIIPTRVNELYTLYEFVRYIDVYTIQHRAFALQGDEKLLEMYDVTETVDFLYQLRTMWANI